MIHALSRLVTLTLLTTLAFPVSAQPAQNVILVTYDGLRWQELFGGLDKRLLSDTIGGVRDGRSIRDRFGSTDATVRREKLLPFMWQVIAKEGVILGDPDANSEIVVENSARVSYPGYSELLCGFVDPAIVNNAPKYNANVTVLEWLNQRDPYRGKVAAFASWNIFNYIINEERVALPVNAGWDDAIPNTSPGAQHLNAITRELPRFWPNVRVDIITHTGAIDHLRQEKPRVLYVGYGETDDWGHDRRYDMVLDSAYRTDAYIGELWETVQSMPEYKDKTALLITTDHGRGDTGEDWISHGTNVPGSDRIWVAAIGAGIRGKGIVQGVNGTQAQIAATVAALLGEDYNADVSSAAPPLPIVKGR